MTRNWFLLNLIQSTNLNIDYSMFFNWRTSRFICILRFIKWTTSMTNLTRIWVVFMSWNKYHEMRLFVNRSIKLSCWDLLFISWFARWESEHDRWIDEFDWSKISKDYRASLLDLRKTMRWLDVTYSYSKRGRNNFKNIHTSRSSKKLDHKYYESFEMQNLVKKQAYRLNLFYMFWIHNVFHVFLLKSFKK
jgi:hypothetical protein